MTRALAALFALVLILGSLPRAGAAQEAGHTGLAAFNPASGRWYLHALGEEHPAGSFFFGIPGDVSLMGDWDCDGEETVGMFRPSTGFAYLRNSNSSGVADEEFFFGIGGDIPLAGDWDGDGCDTLGIYRPGESRVYLVNRLGTAPADTSYLFGVAGDRPFAGDFDGDGRDSVGLYRDASGFVYLRNQQTTGIAESEFFFGVASDQFVSGDWDGDGTDTIGVVRRSSRRVFLRNTNNIGFADFEAPFADADLTVLAGRFPDPGPGSAVEGRIFPTHRVVAYYGNPRSAALGVLGETGPEQAVDRVLAATAPFATAERPVVGAFEIIASVAQAKAGSDGDYSAPTPIEILRPWVDEAGENGLLVILDIQPGRTSFPEEVRRYEELLREPHVGLALDPEWRVGPGEVPGQVTGSVSAAEVNEVSGWLSDLVIANGLPDKLFLVHQFKSSMIRNRSSMIARPGLMSVLHVDGFGPQALKLETYGFLNVDSPWWNGFKLFFDEDTNMFTPFEVLSVVDPVPDLVSYQ